MIAEKRNQKNQQEQSPTITTAAQLTKEIDPMGNLIHGANSETKQQLKQFQLESIQQFQQQLQSKKLANPNP